MPSDKKSQKLLAAWAELYVEYIFRSGPLDPVSPFFDRHAGSEATDAMRIAARSRGQILIETNRLKKALGLENGDLEAALEPGFKERYVFIKNMPEAYFPEMWDQFEKALAEPAKPYAPATPEEKERLLQGLQRLYPDLKEDLREWQQREEARWQTPEHLAMEKEEETKRLELEASFSQVAQAAEKSAALSPLSESKRPQISPEKESAQGKTPEDHGLIA